MSRRLETGVALAATAVLVVLHVVAFLHGGALWRDEANSVKVSSMPAAEMWRSMEWDSFPVLWFALLRAWTALGPGTSDLGLRALALILGLGILAALWYNARALGVGPPLVSLAVLGFNGAVLAFGDSVRSYGLGMLTGLLAFTLAWRFADDPKPRRLLVFAAAALVSVHCLFYNAVFLLASCAGGAAVALRRRRLATLLSLGAVGLVCAGSLLIYRPMMERQKDWTVVVRAPIGVAWIWEQLTRALSLTGAKAFLWLWVALVLLALGAAAFLLRRASALEDRHKDAVAFALAALATGIVAYLLFLLRLSYPMQPWYFLALMAMVAACLEGLLGHASGDARVRAARRAAVVLVMAAALPGLWRMAVVRKTNVDLVAAKLESTATDEDLVVVSPWYCGVSFDRYYRGSAGWVTVPPVSTHGIHRYDLMKRAMMSPDAMRPVLERMQAVLAGGHRVFWVGEIMAPPAGQAPPVLAPAPGTPWRWQEEPYIRSWILQAGSVLRQYGRRAGTIPVPVEGPVNGYENLPVIVVDGSPGS